MPKDDKNLGDSLVIPESQRNARKRLKLLEAKKESLFLRLQSAYDLSSTMDSEINKDIFRTRCSRLTETEKEFFEIIEAINSINLDLDNDYEVNFQPISAFDDMYTIVKTRLKEIDSHRKANEEFTLTQSRPSGSKVKLPPFPVPKFSGKPQEWPMWHRTFKSLICDDESLTDTHRMYFLNDALIDKAKAFVSELPALPENFSVVWEALKERFEDSRLLASAYVDNILDFKQPLKETASSIDSFLIHFVSPAKAFLNLNIPDHADYLLFHLALSRLHPDTVRQFECFLTVSKSSNETKILPTFAQLVSFLREHVKILTRQPVLKIQGTLKKQSSFNLTAMRQSHSLVVQKPAPRCPACDNQPHALYYCSKFKKLKTDDRYALVKRKSLCVNCLSPLHSTAYCKSLRVCTLCSKRHHSLLHRDEKSVGEFKLASYKSTEHGKGSSDTASSQEAESLPNTSLALPACADPPNTNSHNKNTSVLLATARVLVYDRHNQSREIRALIDSASQSNLITTDCCNRLGLPKRKINFSVKGVGSVSCPIKYVTRLTVYSRLNMKESFTIDALVLDEITGDLPTASLGTESLTHLQGLVLADQDFFCPGKIDILLGASLFPLIIQGEKISGPPNTPVALKSCLGYIIMGSVTNVVSPTMQSQVFCAVSEDVRLDELVSRFWSMEEIPSDYPESAPTQLADECENIFLQSFTRSNNGRYSVALPFNRPPSELGGSYHTALQCLFSLEKRLDEQPEIKQAYHAFLKDHIAQGHISLTDYSNSGCYLPHHYVIKPESVSTRLRVVWNASARSTSGLSLNDILHTGPKLHTDLRSVILRFRAFSIAASADLKQMFLQISIKEEHRKFLNFLWRFSRNDEVSTFTLNTVTFGVKPSPYLAQRVIKQLAIDSTSIYPEGLHCIQNNFYIDDFCASFATIDDAMNVFTALVGMFKSGGFELIKWCSNSQTFLNKIPNEVKMPSNHRLISSDTLKILGLRWAADSDFFVYDVSSENASCTKRGILSVLARIFDPLGFISPLTVYIKILLHDLWISKYSWDDILDPKSNLMKKWLLFRRQLPLLKKIKIPRYIGLIPNQSADLIGFCDSSIKAYGAVIYVRTQFEGEARIRLLISSTKIARKNILTIPRLELCSAVLLSRLFNFVISTFKSVFNFNNCFAFSDSSVALYWILSPHNRWNSFVANRVKEIQSYSHELKWRHISGTENPADCLSRGLLPQDFLNHSLWFSGPSWIEDDPQYWPSSIIETLGDELNEEKKPVLVSVIEPDLKEKLFLQGLIEKYSSWQKLLRIVSLLLRWKIWYKNKCFPASYFVTLTELEHAEHVLLGFVQKQHFRDEFLKIKAGRVCPLSLQKLNPFIDPNDGLIRVGGRLSHSELDYCHKHPAILPKKDPLVNLIIDYHHASNFHTGPTLVISILRQKYWILGCRNIVRQRLHRCNTCFRNRPRAPSPLMGDLPSARVTQSKPFLHTGVDYAGPFWVTPYKGRGIKTKKVYICLFVCLCVKAIHIEIASDLSTESFLNAFKRFFSRRGPVTTMYSDCGTNFIGARSHLNEIYQLINSQQFNQSVGSELTMNKIEWKFNAPSSPHMGGVWESQVKAVKTHLMKLTHGHVLTQEEFTTVLTQIEALLNSRPLGILSSDPNDLLPLTPAHFLMQRPLKQLSVPGLDQIPINHLTRFQLLDRLVQQFWNRWHVEYLHTLQTREKWNTPAKPIKLGTIVVVQNEATSPYKWPLAIVKELHPGKDGVVRVATILIGQTLLRRPVIKLYPLPNQ